MSENISPTVGTSDDQPEPDYKALWLNHLQQGCADQAKFMEQSYVDQAKLMEEAQRSGLYRTSWLNSYDFTAKPVTEPKPEPTIMRRMSLSWGWLTDGCLDEIEMSAHMHALQCHVTRFGKRRATIDITGPKRTVDAFVAAVTKAVKP